MYLTPEQKAKYRIMNRIACENYCLRKHEETSIIISIKSITDKLEPKIPITEKNNIRAVLRLSFDDCDKEDDSKNCMQLKDGYKIADFVNKWYSQVDRIIVHCDGGISRSAGVIAAIMRAKEGNDFPIFDSTTKHPNMTCYLMTLKGFRYI